jgi:hypothetical protein
MEPVISPADCALAVALPLTEQQFMSDATARDREFARSVVAGSGRSPADAWSELYAPKVVALCERIAARVRSLGATVATGVTAPALRELLERFPVVTLVAHSVSSAVRPDDIVEPRTVVDLIRAGGTIVARRLREALANRRWSDEETALRHQLAAALDEALAPTRAWTETTVRTDHADRPARYLSRVMLEDCFGTAMRRAPILELGDGLKTMDQLLAAIPHRFAGVLDLSVCNSFAFAESIKRRRQNCVIVENVFLARVEVRLVRYALVLARLAHRPARYSDALSDVSEASIGGSR